MQGQGTRPPAPPTPSQAEVYAEERGPILDGVFEVGDPVRLKGQSAKLWHVIRIDDDQVNSIRISPDCGCGGATWTTPDRLLHDTY